MVDMYEETTTSANSNYDIVENYLSFGQALDKLIERENDDTDNNEYGIRIRTWNEAIVVRIQTPDEGSKMTRRYLYENFKGENIPWVPNNECIFNNFWQIVKFVKNEDIIPDKETINKMTASMLDNKNMIKNWFKENKYDELVKNYKKAKDTCNNDNKCSTNCAKKCLHECQHKKYNDDKCEKVNVSSMYGVIMSADTFDEMIDALLG